MKKAAGTACGTDADYAELEKLMKLLQTTYVDNGVPVIIGEYGCPKNGKEEESVRLYITSVCEATLAKGMCPILWDITDHHYNRKTCKMIDRELIQKLVEICQRFE